MLINNNAVTLRTSNTENQQVRLIISAQASIKKLFIEIPQA